MLLTCVDSRGGNEPSATVSSTDLTDLSIEQLARVQVVTSVSKKPEKVNEAAAAVYVMTGDEVQRSGFTMIPDALRWVPGLQVARLDAHDWAISSRGFNDVFANKLLVLMDGRSVYTPLFSGVYWDVQDTLLEDLDRIEVIRGPGATLWGANAVNGVINVITKSARDTQGLLIMGGGGTEERTFGGVRYGGQLSETAHYRVYGKYFDRADSVLQNSDADAFDAWQMGRGGFRVDWEPKNQNLVTFQGDYYSGVENQAYRVPSLNPASTNTISGDNEINGGNLLSRWSRTFSETASLQLQTFFDHSARDSSLLGEIRDTADIEFQHRFGLGERQQIVWGVGYRFSRDELENSSTIMLNPDNRTTHLYSGFVQDELSLVPERLRLTLGTKLEHNSFTGFEVQPSGRLIWTPNERHSLWGGVARAVRTPSRAEDDARINYQALPAGSLGVGTPEAIVAIFGQRDFESERLLAFELGYRVQPTKRVSLDVASFFNYYDRLRSGENGTVTLEGVPPHLLVPVVLSNRMVGETFGVELAATVQLADWWRLRGSYTWLNMRLYPRAGSTDTTANTLEGQNPRHQFGLRSSMELPGHVAFDCGLRFVDELPAMGVPSYVALDVRLAWRPHPRWEMSVVGLNLLDDRHPEFQPAIAVQSQATEVERSVYGKLTWRF